MAKQKLTESVVVHNNRKGTTTVPGLGLLRPGANIVTREAVERMKKLTTDEDGKSIMAPGLITVDERKAPSSDGREKEDAIALVADTFDLEALTKWREGEKRPAVQKAIDEQIASLIKEPPKGDEDGPQE